MSTVIIDDNGVTLIASSNGLLTITIDRTQNFFNPLLISSLSTAIQKVEEAEHPKALIITGTGKFFSNGLDLSYMQEHGSEGTAIMIESCWRLLARILVMDCRTVAAINGHGFGAGLFLALACDYRIMRTRRGYLNFPEVNLGMTFAQGSAQLIKCKITNSALLRESVLTGKWYSSGDAMAVGMIDEECAMEDLSDRAIACAVAGFPENLNAEYFNPDNFKKIKIELYVDAYRALTLGKINTLPESRL
uniref:Uncharacterized protein n=1 Tax=Proboscia inermis TaxID=420281 RepID=A0A7S0BWB4_9STRA|mmetsp:Transcript_12721/g.12819  ORF Transcript_12721/g.12819 Transcript_12721/m.12819 type:complete len:248 (+) Transcript_12721:20-763(+)